MINVKLLNTLDLTKTKDLSIYAFKLFRCLKLT